MTFIDPRFSPPKPFFSGESSVDPLGVQRRSGVVMGTSLASAILVSPAEGVDPGLDPRFDVRFSKLDIAAEYIERRQSFLANQEAQKLAAQVASEKSAADKAAAEKAVSAGNSSAAASSE